jgi:hypothetical protein
MKVYQLRVVTKLICSAKDQKFLDAKNFSGCPFPEKWKHVDLLLANGTGPQADFYGFGTKAFVCSERVRLEGGPLEDEGEFLPVKIKGLEGRFYIYNVTHCCSHLNPKKTVWKPGKTEIKSRSINSPAFHAERLGEDCVFKIPEDDATAIYCLERNDIPGFEGLKTLVKRCGLTGLEFELVWTDEKPKRAKRDHSSS